MEDLNVIVYTNETYFNITYITIPQLKKNLPNVKINLVSNKFPNEFEKFDYVNYIETNVPFVGDGSHFRDSMLNALVEIDCEYFFFICDDYIFRGHTKMDKFNQLIPIMKESNIHFLTLATQKHMGSVIDKWKLIDCDVTKYGFPKNCFHEMPDNYLYLFSVQPCIWKKTSLIEILNYNPNLSLHALDTTNIKNKKGEMRERNPLTVFYFPKENFYDYDSKNVCMYLDPISFAADERFSGEDYLIIDYCEVIRHGKLIEPQTISKNFFLELLDNEYKNIKPKLDIFF